MDYYAGRFQIEENNYYLRNKKPFLMYSNMLRNDKQECFNFAYNMSFARKGEHRDSRSGGFMHRTKGQIFINTFQGKMAEFALYRYLMEHNIEVDKPDTSEYELGIWDSFDLVCQGKHFSVKSTKYYGNLLLLETKDWNWNGEYIPNLSFGQGKYDYTVLVRFKPDGEGLMKKNKLLYLKDDMIPKNIREILEKNVCNQDWAYDFPGFIYQSELIKMIREKHIIPQNALLNGKTRMDAENYYFQAGNMHSMEELYMKDITERVDERADLRLKRKCPRCGRNLALRHGYNWFWGCEGYFSQPRCRYIEPIEMINL